MKRALFVLNKGCFALIGLSKILNSLYNRVQRERGIRWPAARIDVPAMHAEKV